MHHVLHGRRRTTLAVLTTTVTLAVLSACGSGSGTAGSSDTGSTTTGDPKTLVVATHDSWAMSKEVMAKFTTETGITVKIQPQGDAGALTNKLVLTKDSPLADGVYGIDNTFGSRAVEEGLLTPYAAPRTSSSARALRLEGEGSDQLAPIDYSDVCVNVDDTWFAERGKTPPRTLADLTEPAYRDLFVTPGATTSSPGLAFLLATIASEGEDWPAYWEKLVANGAKIDAGWTDAYEVDFTAGGGNGTRPIVLSYSSSPPFTIPEGESRPTTSALLDTCFRQVEYAGVLAGSKNPVGMKKFIDFMQGQDFQAALPENMYVYPADTTVALPKAWARFATPASQPLSVDAAELAENRSAWLREWRDVTSR